MKQHSKVWYSSRISPDNAEIQEYLVPKELYLRNNFLTIIPATARGYSEVLKYGETLNDTWTAIANANIFHNTFKIGDLFYLDGEEPNLEIESKYGNGASANAEIKSVSYVQNTISITLVRNQKQVKL